MKGLRFIFLGLLLVITSGCFTTRYVVEWKARRHIEFDKEKDENVVPDRPIYYALLPLTVAADIATAPIQFGILIAWPVAKMPKVQERQNDVKTE